MLRRMVGPAVVLAAGLAAIPVTAASPVPVVGDIAYVTGGHEDVRLMAVSTTGGAPRDLWSGPVASGLSWSPVDHALAFTSVMPPGSDADFAVRLVDATGVDHLLVTGQAVATSGWIEPGLVVDESSEDGTNLHVVDSTGAAVRDLDVPAGVLIDAALASPDGKHLAVTRLPWGSDELPTVSFYDAPEWRRRDLQLPASQIAWSPDSTALAVRGDDGIAVVDAATGEVRMVGALPADDLPRGLRWSGDGRRLVVATYHGRAVDGEVSLLSVPASGSGLDLGGPAGDVLELTRSAGDMLRFADGPADGPLAWSLVDFTVDDPDAARWTTGIVGRDGRTVDSIVAGSGVAVPMSWDATGSLLLVSDTAGLEILDPATDAVRPLVDEPVQPIQDARWWRPRP